MDCHMRYADVEQTMRTYQAAIQGLNETIRVLENNIREYEGGAFLGRTAETYIQLTQRKIGLVKSLIGVFDRSIALLRKAQQEMQNADNDLKSRLGSI